MKNLKNNFGNIITLTGELLIGIILLIKPVGFTKTIIISIGLILTILGSINIIKYFKSDVFDAIKEQTLANGLIYLAIGLFCVLNSNWFIVTFPVLTALYGIIIFLISLRKVQWTVDSIRLKRKSWFIIGINALLSIIFAIVVIKNPFTTTAVLWQFMGAMLIVAAIFDIASIAFNIQNND